MKTCPRRPAPGIAADSRRPRMTARMAAIALTSAVALLWSQSAASAEPGPTSSDGDPPQAELPVEGDPAPSQAAQRTREGTEIVGQPGYFRMTGDRVTFVTDDGQQRFIGLENMNLERVARMIADNPDQLEWTVTGTVTEYRGSNFLFIRRAVLKTILEPEEEPY